MTNKSEELFKLLGIEPIYKKGQKAYIKIDGVPTLFRTDKDIYPDLTKPSNFVKLLNFCFNFFEGLEIQYFDNEARECEEQGKPYDSRDCFIDCLILDLTTKSKDRFYLEIDYQSFVEGLQQIEWEY